MTPSPSETNRDLFVVYIRLNTEKACLFFVQLTLCVCAAEMSKAETGNVCTVALVVSFSTFPGQ